MSLIIVSSKAGHNSCSITRSGVVVSQSIVEKLSWTPNNSENRVEIGFLTECNWLLVGKPSDNPEGFLLSLSKVRIKEGRKVGATISCIAFVKNYLQAIIPIPKKGIIPIMFKDKRWSFAIPIENFSWQEEEFSKAGVNKISSKLIGVYQLLGNEDSVLRVGEGKISDRLNAHLSDPMRFLPRVKKIRYFQTSTKEDAELAEKILIAKYENETGVLPPLNEVRA
jgi:hypothetical protein